MATRRQLGLGLGTVAVAAAASARRASLAQAQADPWAEELGRRFAEIEARLGGGRLGVGVFDTQSGRTAGHRGDERFPMCSTHKALGAAAVLARVDRGEDGLDRLLFGEALSPASRGRSCRRAGFERPERPCPVVRSARLLRRVQELRDAAQA